MTGLAALFTSLGGVFLAFLFGVILWYCVIRPRLEGPPRSRERVPSRDDISDLPSRTPSSNTDLELIQENAEQIKGDAERILLRVMRLQHLERGREEGERLRDPQEDGKE